MEKWRQYFGLLLNSENPVEAFAQMPKKPNKKQFKLLYLNKNRNKFRLTNFHLESFFVYNNL